MLSVGLLLSSSDEISVKVSLMLLYFLGVVFVFCGFGSVSLFFFSGARVPVDA